MVLRLYAFGFSAAVRVLEHQYFWFDVCVLGCAGVLRFRLKPIHAAWTKTCAYKKVAIEPHRIDVCMWFTPVDGNELCEVAH